MPQEQSYKKLLSLTEELEIKQKNFIIETVRSHGGIITFKPKLEDGEDNDTGTLTRARTLFIMLMASVVSPLSFRHSA